MGYLRIVAKAIIQACKTGFILNVIIVGIASAAVLYSFVSALEAPRVEKVRICVKATIGNQTFQIQNASVIIAREIDQFNVWKLLAIMIPFVPAIQTIATYGINPINYGPILYTILEKRVNSISPTTKTSQCLDSLRNSLPYLRETVKKGQMNKEIKQYVEGFIEELEKCEKLAS